MKLIRLKIKRQDHEKSSSYWEYFEVRSKEQMTVAQALYEIRRNPINMEGVAVSPVVWDDHCLSEACGSCSMIVNGVVKLACQTKIEDLDQPIKIEPLSKFKVLRDLLVDKAKLQKDLNKIYSWMSLDKFDPSITSPLSFEQTDSLSQSLSQCTECLACLEVCPQYNDQSAYMGALPIAKTYRFNHHVMGRHHSLERNNVMMDSGGVSDCGHAQNCVNICPQQIPLTEAIGRIKRQVVGQVFKKFLV